MERSAFLLHLASQVIDGLPTPPWDKMFWGLSFAFVFTGREDPVQQTEQQELHKQVRAAVNGLGSFAESKTSIQLRICISQGLEYLMAQIPSQAIF